MLFNKENVRLFNYASSRMLACLQEQLQHLTASYIKQSLLYLLLLTYCTAAYSQTIEPSSESSSANSSFVSPLAAPLRVNNGALEADRIALLTKIQEAQGKGVGIENYMSAFLDLERLVHLGASQESIRERLDSIDQALKFQLSHQEDMKHLAAPFTESQATKQSQESHQEDTKQLGEGRPNIEQSQRKLMPLDTGRLYILRLVNADRAKYHLAPLTLDLTASAAGQVHADEMALLGYCAHWDTSGKKPDQRYTEAGGTHSVGENLAYKRSVNSIQKDFGNYELVKNRTFSPGELQELESYFMNEKPPYDLHRQEILRREHNKLGVGLSRSVSPNGESFISLAQEFVDAYGEYAKIPKKLVRGIPFQLSGSLFQGMELYSVSIHWEGAPKPMTKEELEMMPSHYSIPTNTIASYTKSSSAMMKVWTKAKRQHFSMQITPNESWKSGLYYVLIWAIRPNDKSPILISARTSILID